MARIKGIKKGFKYISKIFVAKDRELEIGLPTDCKHVAHIGWDSHSDNQPSWMGEFKKPSDFSVPSLCSLKPGDPNFYPATWSSQDFKQTLAEHPVSELFNDTQDIPPLSAKAQMSPKAQKKHKRKKSKLSPKSSFSSSSRTLRGTTSRSQSLVATFGNILPKLQEATS